MPDRTEALFNNVNIVFAPSHRSRGSEGSLLSLEPLSDHRQIRGPYGLVSDEDLDFS